MRRTSRLTRSVAVLGVLAALSAGAAVVAPTMGSHPSSTAAAATAPTLSVMGQSQLTAADLVRYYKSVNHLPYRVITVVDPFANPPVVVPVPVEELANHFVTEGNRYNVRGDVAFAQSLVETAWFNFPDYGQVRTWNNNFAGIGACDSCNNGYQFPSTQIGVRAQIQLLRNYADGSIQAANLPDPPLPSLWGSTPQRATDNFNRFSHKGRAPYWSKSDCSSGCMGNGNWATAPTYSSTVVGLYSQMLAFFGRSVAPETIADHYAALGGSSGFLGSPQGPEQDVPGGRMRTYAGGNIYWSSAAGAYEVHGAILLLYGQKGGPTSPLGFPLTDEASTSAGGRANLFQGGGIYWTPGTGAHEVHGEIGRLYQSLGGPSSVLGFPLTDETSTPGGAGRFNDFQGGSIYWSPSTGAHEVHGLIRDLYRSAGGPASSLGFPVGDERAVPGGRASAFQGGEILWSLATGAHAVRGAIAFLYGLIGGPGSYLGLPTADETAVSGGAGLVSTFQGGSIYWSAATGVHAVHGPIGDLYRSFGGPASYFGLPVADERDVGAGRAMAFQGGEIFWSQSTGAHEAHGSVLDLYRFVGGPASFLGFPLTNETVTPDGIGRYNTFQGGSIFWTQPTGAHEVHGAIRDLWVSSGSQAGPLGYPLTNELSTPDGVGRYNRFQGGTVAWLPAWGAFRL